MSLNVTLNLKRDITIRPSVGFSSAKVPQNHPLDRPSFGQQLLPPNPLPFSFFPVPEVFPSHGKILPLSVELEEAYLHWLLALEEG